MNRLVLVALVAIAHSGYTHAQQQVEFRVIKKIFAGDATQPSVEHLILFDTGVAYELPRFEDRFVTVYDSSQAKVTLLDRLTQVQSEVGREELVRVTVKTRMEAKTDSQKKQFGLLAQVSQNKLAGAYQIQYGGFEYQVTAQQPGQPAVAQDYGLYADLAARLNIVRRIGPPPFGRMKLNQAIAAGQTLPRNITLHVTRNGHRETFRSTIEMSPSLDASDRKRIDEIRGMLQLYRHVPLANFPRGES
ncbi:MAG: hypothetical protein MI861_14180 [Pirellulales bacterium]|nr:hypothetical protein [Pirellulales bacterium]